MSDSKSTLQFDRRTFLFLAIGAGATALAAQSSMFKRDAKQHTPGPFEPRSWTPVRYPIPVPGGRTEPSDLQRFEVSDSLTLPPEFEFEVITQWGDSWGPKGAEIRVGYNCDFTGLIPIAGAIEEYYLVINHEYVSARPWRDGFEKVHGKKLPDLRIVPHPDAGWSELLLELDSKRTTFGEIDEKLLPEIHEALEVLATAQIEEVGLSILHVRRENGHIRVVDESERHKRITGNRALNIDSASRFELTGPASRLISSIPLGTLSNCGGAITPWGTVLTCEENFQEWFPDALTPEGDLLDHRKISVPGDHSPPYDLPVLWENLGAFIEPTLESRTYGWVVEVDPTSGHLKKHSALGRFRHENVALVAAPGKPLVAYMGDDRRGGHLWRYVSEGIVRDVRGFENSKLFENGVLSCAQFNEDGTGHWLPLNQDSKLAVPNPEVLATKHLKLPNRPDGGFVSVGTDACQYSHISVEAWIASIESYCRASYDTLKLRNLIGESVRQLGEAQVQAVILLDAFAFANAIGGTPLARPEGIQLHPGDGSIYVAFSDSSGREIGSPDTRIFPASNQSSSKRYGDLFRLVSEPDSDSFQWSRWVSSGEAVDGGGGFACADNITFDSDRNIWMACDVETKALNQSVNRDKNSAPGTATFTGIFGNNALFAFETYGTEIGIPRCFAIGPMECELTGMSFTEDGHTMVMSVQHPGERNGARTAARGNEERFYRIAQTDGTTFEQRRSVPIGSNFPSDEIGVAPSPSVVSIRRRSSV